MAGNGNVVARDSADGRVGCCRAAFRALAHVHMLVAVGKQCIDGVMDIWVEPDEAARKLDREAPPRGLVVAVHGTVESCNHLAGCRERGIREQSDEFVATDTREQIGFAELLPRRLPRGRTYR